MRVQLYRLLVAVVVFGTWEFVVRAELIDAFFISSPSLIAQRFWKVLLDGTLIYHSYVTFTEAFSGLVAGTVVGVTLGLLLGVSPVAGRVFEPYIMALNSLPRVALGPLLVMYVGIGFASKFLLAFSLVVVIIMINTYEGVKAVDPPLVNALRVLGARRHQMFFKLLVPVCIPWVLAALRVAIALAIVGAIVGEFISARAGIGYLIDTASGSYDATGIMVPLFTLMLLAIALDGMLLLLTKYLLRWRKSAFVSA